MIGLARGAVLVMALFGAACGERAPGSADASAPPKGDAPLRDAASGDAALGDAAPGDAASGDAAPGESTLAIAPANLDFGAVRVSMVSDPVTVTVANTGTATSPPLEATVIGTDATAFALVDTTCTGALAAGTTCSARVTFAPQTTGAATARLAISDGTSAVASQLTGTGATADLLLSLSVYDYGAVPVNSTSAMTFTLTNAGSVGIDALVVTTEGADLGDFTIATPTCAGASIAAGGTCTISVGFRPSVTGTRSADLHVTTSGGVGAAVTASLLGMGVHVQAPFAITPAMHDFGTVQIGSNSFGVQFTVTNVSPIASGTITTIVVGPHPGDFQVMANNCTGSLASGASCTLFVTFEPGAIGPRSASVYLFANPGGTVAAAVSGTCTP